MKLEHIFGTRGLISKGRPHTISLGVGTVLIDLSPKKRGRNCLVHKMGHTRALLQLLPFLRKRHGGYANCH